MTQTVLQNLFNNIYTLGYTLYFFSMIGSFLGLIFILISVLKISISGFTVSFHESKLYKISFFLLDVITLPIILLIISLPLHNPDFKFLFLNIPSAVFSVIKLSFGTEFIRYTSKIFIDGLSLNFIVLTIFISYFCYSLCSNLDNEKKHFYKIVIFTIKNFLIICFTTGDLVTFFFSFEATLLPMIALIYVFGSRQRKRRAANYLLLYTLVGSICLLFATILMKALTRTVDIINLSLLFSYVDTINGPVFTLIWLLFFISFAVKVPIVPFHSWLAEAHVEAPTVGSVLLAALLLKLGGYGFIRVLIFIFPELTAEYLGVIESLCLISGIYASLIALRQLDIKRIIAYSSIAHMNYALLGLFSLNFSGLVASVALMVGHGIVAAGLFTLAGLLYDRTRTRLVLDYGGFIAIMPHFSLIFFIFTLANFGFPFTCNFFGELFTLQAIIQVNIFFAIGAAIMIILSIAFSLWLYSRVCLGTLKLPYNDDTVPSEIGFFKYTDLKREEYEPLWLLLITVVFIGLYPQILIEDLPYFFAYPEIFI